MSVGEKSTSEVLEGLQNKGDYFSRLIIIERKRLSDLEDALAHISKEIDSLRDNAKKAAIEVMNLNILTPNPAYTRADGANIGKEAEIVTHKMLTILEAKLNKLLQRKSEAKNSNKEIKKEIDHMRRLRLQTDTAHHHFEEQLAKFKTQIESLMGESTGVMEKREKIVELKESLERANIEEQRKFEEEYEEMGVFIRDQNANLEETLLKERNSDILNDFEFQQGDLSVEEEDEMAGRVGQLTNFVVNEQNSLTNIQKTIHNYEKMFEQLKRITNTDSLEEVISTYSTQEEEMFSLYNYIQSQNTEIELVVEATQRLRAEIETYETSQQEEEVQRLKILNSLEQKYKNVIDTTTALSESNEVNRESVHQIAKKVQSLFFKLQCDQVESAKGNAASVKGSKNSASISRNENKVAILTGQGVTESNVLDYMGAIEQRAVDIIAEYIRTQAHYDGPRSPTPGPDSPMRWPADTHFDFPELDDEELFVEGEDVESKPVDLGTFKERLSKKLNFTGTM